jgi:hypothetical protein
MQRGVRYWCFVKYGKELKIEMRGIPPISQMGPIRSVLDIQKIGESESTPFEFAELESSLLECESEVGP